jgi:hypothetical protein
MMIYRLTSFELLFQILQITSLRLQVVLGLVLLDLVQQMNLSIEINTTLKVV